MFKNQKGLGMVLMPLIPALGRKRQRQRQVDLCEFKASLVDILSSRPVRPCLKITESEMVWEKGFVPLLEKEKN